MGNKFTLRDRVLQDSLASLASYEDLANTKLVVDGGIASQIYINDHFPNLLRPTHDLDLLAAHRFTQREFKEQLGEYFKTLLGIYSPEVHVLRHNYEIKLKDKGKNLFFIHTYRWTIGRFDIEKRNMERRVSNSTRVKIPNSEGEVYVVRPEDIVHGKLRRLKKLEELGKLTEECKGRYGDLVCRDWESLASQDFSELLGKVMEKKNRLPAFLDASREAFKSALDDFVCSKDIYDTSLVSLLSSLGLIEFDESYYDRIVTNKD